MARKIAMQSSLERSSEEEYRIVFPFVKRFYTEEEIATVIQVMRNGVKQTQDSYLEGFEKAFRNFTGANNAFGVNSCTSALMLSAIFCHIKPGDEVIVPAYASWASAIVFGNMGAQIVWGDIHPDTWTLDPKDVMKKITPKTKAVVAVHLAGNPCDIKEIVRIAHEQGVMVIEDCAHALDCRVDGQHAGTFGDFGCFSFHASGMMTTLGEGGMFVCRDNNIAGFVGGIRCAGASISKNNYEADLDGTEEILEDCWPQHYCLGEAQCALGIEQLKLVPANGELLIKQSHRIREALGDISEFTFQAAFSGARYVPDPYILHYDGSAYSKNREDLLELLKTGYGMQAAVLFKPLYREKLFQVKGCDEQDCPVLEQWWKGSFALPWWSNMAEKDLEYICGALRGAAIELRSQKNVKIQSASERNDKQ